MAALGMCERDRGTLEAGRMHVNTRESRKIHGGSMLHVLPAATYGLRPAVNRSNTRVPPWATCGGIVLCCTILHTLLQNSG